MSEYIDDNFIRSFEEFDEKLPHVAKVIVQRGIDFDLICTGDDGEVEITQESSDAFQSIYFIFKEMVECTSEMTTEEFECYFDQLLTGCTLVSLVSDGIVQEDGNGEFSLTEKGKDLKK